MGQCIEIIGNVDPGGVAQEATSVLADTCRSGAVECDRKGKVR